MFIARHLADPVIEACRDSPVVLVNGARQTGKSTLVQSLFTGADSPDYLTFDDITVLAAAG
ncbi:MAG: hypothetical protein GVY13_16610 [Alphaproteobacteria bacterium]|jgi:predicted AAA+ superfamily ATPase|nr:hypothetical protein [Alphaproteobacteria bacterium]